MLELIFNTKINGYLLFGTSYCDIIDDNGMMHFDVITEYRCKLCWHTYEWSDSSTSVICYKCSKIAGRYTKCGKLL